MLIVSMFNDSMLNSHEQDKEWGKKLSAMEAVFTSNARQAEKERDVLRIQLKCYDGAPCKKATEVEVDIDMNASYQQLLEENNQLKDSLLHLKDRCAWQTELEQVQNIYSNRFLRCLFSYECVLRIAS